MTAESRRLSILTGDEIEDLYGLPTFTEEERSRYFDLSPSEAEALGNVRNNRGTRKRVGADCAHTRSCRPGRWVEAPSICDYCGSENGYFQNHTILQFLCNQTVKYPIFR